MQDRLVQLLWWVVLGATVGLAISGVVRWIANGGL